MASGLTNIETVLSLMIEPPRSFPLSLRSPAGIDHCHRADSSVRIPKCFRHAKIFNAFDSPLTWADMASARLLASTAE